MHRGRVANRRHQCPDGAGAVAGAGPIPVDWPGSARGILALMWGRCGSWCDQWGEHKMSLACVIEYWINFWVGILNLIPGVSIPYVNVPFC